MRIAKDGKLDTLRINGFRRMVLRNFASILPGSIAYPDEQFVVPSSGDIITISNIRSILLVNPAGGLAALTINMPPNPGDGQLAIINITKDITALTHSGNGKTLLAPFDTTISSFASGTWYYHAADTTWYPISAPIEIGSGPVLGPGSSTDNALARWNGVTGTLLANSVAILDDLGVLTGLTQLDVDDLRLDGNIITTTAGDLELDASSNLVKATADVQITGDLVVQGTTFSTLSENVLIAANYLHNNSDYTVAVAQTGGLTVRYLPTATADTVAGAFTAGVAAVSNPTVVTTGVATFAVSDILAIDTANDPDNDGLFECLSHVGTLLTVRGIGTVGTIEDFTNNQFVADAVVAGTITKVNVSIIRSDTAGDWETGKGAVTGITFSNLINGPASATDDAIVRFDGTSGSLLQNSILTLDDSGDIERSGVDYIHTKGGTENFSAGIGALSSITTGSRDSTFGFEAGKVITLGDDNSFFGWNAGVATTIAGRNSAFGSRALETNISGTMNTVVGYQAGNKNTDSRLTAVGVEAAEFNSTGSSNSVFGAQAANFNNFGDQNCVFGDVACFNPTATSRISAFGYNCLRANSLLGDDCSAFGANAASDSSNTSSELCAFGSNSLRVNETGTNLAAFGFDSLTTATAANDCSAFGHKSMEITTGVNNSGFGSAVLSTLTTGTGNSAFGQGADVLAVGAVDRIAIGRSAVSQADRDAQIGQRVDGGTGIMYYRTQEVSREDWIGGGVTLANIDGSGNIERGITASGVVVGPASSTDNALARFDGVTGKLLQNSIGILDDLGNMTVGVDGASRGTIELDRGAGGTTPGFIRLTAAGGSKERYFCDANGYLRSVDDIPTADTDGVDVGTIHQSYGQQDMIPHNTTPPLLVTTGTTPQVSGWLFAAVADRLSIVYTIPPHYKGGDLTIDLIYMPFIILTPVAGDLANWTCDYVVTNPSTGVHDNVNKTSTNVTGSTAAQAGFLSSGSSYTTAFNLPAADASNPLAAGWTVYFEFGRASVGGIGFWSRAVVTSARIRRS